jgi:polyketide cyclase/dehydrase/lipid transport protein
MSPNESDRKIIRVEASADVGAAAADTYRMIADYRDGHTRIIPAKYFRNLRVTEGGYGEGTAIEFDMLVFGKATRARARVSEPEPGRVLVERYPDTGWVTSFIVEPRGSSASRVTIRTDAVVRAGLLGRLEGAFVRSFLSRVFPAELAQLDEQVRMRTAAPTPTPAPQHVV